MKKGLENEASFTKNQRIYFSSNASKLSTTVGSHPPIVWPRVVLLHLAGRSLAAFGHAAGSVTDQPMTRSDSDEEFNAGQRAESSANLKA